MTAACAEAAGSEAAGAEAAGAEAAAAPARGAAAPTLLVTIHDVAPRSLAEVQALRRALLGWGVARATLLVVPHFHRELRLCDHSPTVAWLRSCAERGDELALHGYYHQQAGAPLGLRDRVRARLWTAGEGECLRPHDDLAGLLVRGRDELTRCLGLVPGGFVAPAWLEPRGFDGLLSRLGFAWHETSMYVEALAGPGGRVRAPVIGFATRTALREAASLVWARALLARMLPRDAPARAPLVRVALHPGDLRSARVMAALEQVLRRAQAAGVATTTSEYLRARAGGG